MVGRGKTNTKKMVRTGAKLSIFCLNKIRPHVRVRSPTIQSKGDVNSGRIGGDVEVSGGGGDGDCGNDRKLGVAVAVAVAGRKIMIVVDSSVEAKNALQWALTHSVQNQDVVTLLYVVKPSKHGEESGKGKTRKVPDFLCSMKNLCELKRPEVTIEISMVEGKEKGWTIVEEAKKQEVALLVLGQKRQSMTWRMLMTWAGNRVGGGVLEHCIHNAACMAVAVRRKSKKLGGYLITTKKQKDFWLLA